MSASSAQDRERRINLSINRLIAQLAPLAGDDAEHKQEGYAETIKAAFKEKPTPAITSDVNHASDLIKQKLIRTSPNQALRYTSLYSRLLALPVLGQKWAMLYLLFQLADSHDPTIDDREAYEEYVKEERDGRRARDQRRRPLSRGAPASSPASASKHVFGRDSGENILSPTGMGLKNVPPPPRPRPKATRQASVDIESEVPESMYGSRELKRGREMEAEPALPPAKRDVSIKSKLLADNYSDYDPSEPALLRDLPYTLQGLSSTTLPFGPKYTLQLPHTLPAPLISLLHTLAEPSLLYRNLDDFVQTPGKGLLNQSLRAAVTNELRAYLTLVATLEGQIRLALSTIDEKAPRYGIGKAGVTLKRCVVWTREATMGLRLLSLIADESKSKRGGQLISLIYSFSSSHGDPIVGAFAERLLVPVTRPFYDILRHWIYDGELLDPFKEFFVREQSVADQAPKGKSGSANVWEDKYMVVLPMIPSNITHEFAEKVFLIGKSLNFIRHSCKDAHWVESYSKESSKELRYGDTATLEAWIDEAYKTTMRRLLVLMTEKFQLLDHLQALKSYILLGQGDFIALLMESLAANLDRPAGAQYRHTLTAQLEHAIRGSNAQYDSPEVLRRLDARMLQLSHGDIGWDCFTLEYKVDAPVDVVVSDWGNRQYLKVFNFLWRLKRVEFALSSTWRKVTTGSRGVLQTRHAAVQQAWKTTRGVLAEMVHFVGQLQYYILFEVIESSWTELQNRLREPDITLDDMIHAHTKYLNSITHKGLLGARRRRFNPGTSGGTSAAAAAVEEDDNSYMIQLAELLHAMLSYRDCVDGLYSWSVSDFTQRQEFGLLSSAQNQPSASAARGTTTDQDHHQDETPGGPQSEFPVLQERLRHLGDRFRTKLQVLLGDLAYQADVDLRFLGVAMNFNDVYQPVRRRAKSTPGPAATGTGEKGAKG